MSFIQQFFCRHTTATKVVVNASAGVEHTVLRCTTCGKEFNKQIEI